MQKPNIKFLADSWLHIEFHPTKNDPIKVSSVAANSGKKIWWKCSKCNFEWQATPNNRSNGTGCPYCAGRVVTIENCLATTHPHLLTEWNPSKNQLTPYVVKAFSNKKIWWKCNQCTHEWLAPVYSRTKGLTGCPACAGKAVTPANCLSNKRPDLLDEWSPLNDKSPNEVTCHSSYKAYWICKKCHHQWQESVDERVNKGRFGCGACAGRIVTSKNCLATTNSQLASEWDYNRNSPTTPLDVTAHGGNRKKFWWICPKCKHHYQATLNNRSNGKSCPACAGLVATKTNCLATLYPKLAEQWHTPLNTCSPFDVTPKSDLKVWWKCAEPSCGHIWRTSVKHRSNGTECPKCASQLQTSLPEQLLYFYLSKVFPNALNRHQFSAPKTRGYEGDIYIPTLSLVIEYDGLWHAQVLAKDERKDLFFKSIDIRVLRIRDFKLPILKKGLSDVLLSNTKRPNYETLVKLLHDLKSYLLTHFDLNYSQQIVLDTWDRVQLKDDLPEIASSTHVQKTKRSLLSRYPELVAQEWDYTKMPP